MTVHQHLWRTLSTHLTGDGIVRYQSCPCGQWRILTGEVSLTEVASSSTSSVAGSR